MASHKQTQARVAVYRPYAENRRRKASFRALATLAAVTGLIACLFAMSGHAAGGKPVPFAATAMDMRGASPARPLDTRTVRLTQAVGAVDALEAIGADRDTAQAAIDGLIADGLIDQRHLSPGLTLTASFETQGDDAAPILAALSLRPDAGRTVLARLKPDGEIMTANLASRLHLSHRVLAGKVKTDLVTTLAAAELTPQTAAQFRSIFAYDRALRHVDSDHRFELVQEVWEDERGTALQTGDIVYAALQGDAIDRAFYRHSPEGASAPDYFDETGKAGRAFLMRRPVRGAHITSGFGNRRHPLGGYTHLHAGVDFAAPMSTKIYAAGAGTVIKRGRSAGYGRYIRIAHANGYETLYAHMSGYSYKMVEGAQVSQGDLVGFVGATGAVTGPHLHYEVRLNGKLLNPMKMHLPTGRSLSRDAALMAEFEAYKQNIDDIRRRHSPQVEVNVSPAIETASTDLLP